MRETYTVWLNGVVLVSGVSPRDKAEEYARDVLLNERLMSGYVEGVPQTSLVTTAPGEVVIIMTYDRVAGLRHHVVTSPQG